MALHGRVRNGEDVSQEDYVRYLSSKVEDDQYDDFTNVFSKLNRVSQRAFFAESAQNGKLIEAMDHLPRDLKEAHFSLGVDFLHDVYFNKAFNLAGRFVTKLSEFNSLEKIEIDLTGVAYNTRRLQESLVNIGRLSEVFGGMQIGRTDGIDMVEMPGGFFRSSNRGTVEYLCATLIECMKKTPSFRSTTLTLKPAMLVSPRVSMSKAERDGHTFVVIY